MASNIETTEISNNDETDDNCLAIDDNIINTLNDNNFRKLIKLWQNIRHKPKCIIFDLDYTLWPFILDSNVLPPFTFDSKTNKIIDHNKKHIQLYQDVYNIIIQLKQITKKDEIYLTIASRSSMKNYAVQLLEMFNILKYFDSIQIYSGTKLKHVKNIRQELIENKQQKNVAANLIDFNQMIFYDDNKSNLQCVAKLGIVGHQVKRHYGLNYQELFDGILKYQKDNI